MAASPTSLEQIPLRPITRKKKPSLRLPDGSKPLTTKQQRFVLFYRRGQNPTQAAISAGYSESVAKNACVELLQNPRVIEEILRQDSDYLSDEGLNDPKEMIKKTVIVARANIADYAVIQEDGTFKIDLSNCNRDQLYAIRRLSYDPEGRPDIELESREKARDVLLKYGFLKNQDSNGMNGNGFPTLQALDSIVQKVINHNVQINILSKPTESKVLSRSEIPAIESADKRQPVSVGDSDSNDDSSQ